MNLCKELCVDELSNLFAVGPVLMENNNNMNTPLASWITTFGTQVGNHCCFIQIRIRLVKSLRKQIKSFFGLTYF